MSGLAACAPPLGPENSLSSFVRRHVSSRRVAKVVPSRRRPKRVYPYAPRTAARARVCVRAGVSARARARARGHHAHALRILLRRSARFAKNMKSRNAAEIAVAAFSFPFLPYTFFLRIRQVTTVSPSPSPCHPAAVLPTPANRLHFLQGRVVARTAGRVLTAAGEAVEIILPRSGNIVPRQPPLSLVHVMHIVFH